MKETSSPLAFSGFDSVPLQGHRTTERTDAVSSSLTREKLERLINDWFSDSEIRCFSPQTINRRQNIVSRLYWFLDNYDLPECGTPELRRFFAYLTNGHQHRSGRWGKTLAGKKINERYAEPLRPVTVQTYHRVLGAFFNWAVLQEYLPSSPMAKVPKVQVSEDQQTPFTDEHIAALLRAASRTRQPKRDAAILWLLLDTGMRAGELYGLTFGDIDIDQRIVQVLGKGNKYRTLSFGLKTRRVLMAYITSQETKNERGDFTAFKRQPLFCSTRGPKASAPLTNRSINLLFDRLGKLAGITGMQVSPHICRHTFAVNFLLAGGDAFSLMRILGHTNLAMTKKYVNMANSDVVSGMRKHSPMDRLK